MQKTTTLKELMERKWWKDLSETSAYRLTLGPDFPKPIIQAHQIPKRWKVSEVVAWERARGWAKSLEDVR